MKLSRTIALAALLAAGTVGGSFAGSTAKSAKPAHKTATAATQYQCAMCKIKLSAKDAKAHGYKCPSCGMKLTMVKNTTKTTPKGKKG